MQRVFEKIITAIQTEMDDVIVKDTYSRGKRAGLRKAEIIVNEVAEEDADGWIPCSERLPDKSGWFLCTQEYHSLKDGKVVKVTTELVEFYNNEWRRSKNLIVTHWQPLPEPYKAESEE